MGYNHLDLPTNINPNGAVITYAYDANGNKLKSWLPEMQV
jgi:YD repeat-containing protein